MVKAEIKLTLANGTELVCCVADVEAQLLLKQDQGDRFEEYRPQDGTMTATLHGRRMPKKIWIAQASSFRDPHVFSTREKAKDFIDRYPELFGGPDVDQYIVEVELDPQRYG
jgi:hypothetical protein